MTPEEVNKYYQNKEKYKKPIKQRTAKYCPKCRRAREVMASTENCPICKTRLEQFKDYNSIQTSSSSTTTKTQNLNSISPVIKVLTIISSATRS